jgi:hypothetical protein
VRRPQFPQVTACVPSPLLPRPGLRHYMPHLLPCVLYSPCAKLLSLYQFPSFTSNNNISFCI